MSKEEMIDDIRSHVKDAFCDHIRNDGFVKITDEACISISDDDSGVYADLDFDVEAGVVVNYASLYTAINDNNSFCRRQALAEAKKVAKVAAEMYDLPINEQ